MTDSAAVSDKEQRVRDHFRAQADASVRLGSPFMAVLCRIIAEVLDHSTATGRRVLGWGGRPDEDVLSLRLCGGLHRLVLSRADPALVSAYPPNPTDAGRLRAAVEEAFHQSDDYLLGALEGAPQTNEIARSAMLLPGFLEIARHFRRPLDIAEIGSSAGLNLLFDRFHYRYDTGEAGDPASTVRLAPEVIGRPPPLDGSLAVAKRSGSDIAPLDITDEVQRLRLRSFVWPDQAVRLQRLDAAIALARAEPFTLEKADAAHFVRSRLDRRSDGAVFVLFHSIIWQYMPDESRARIERMLTEAGNSSGMPLAWLRMEPRDTREPHATLSLTMWPGGETRHLARCDFHGRWIEWIG
jgi:hypothetical protein